MELTVCMFDAIRVNGNLSTDLFRTRKTKTKMQQIRRRKKQNGDEDREFMVATGTIQRLN